VSKLRWLVELREFDRAGDERLLVIEDGDVVCDRPDLKVRPYVGGARFGAQRCIESRLQAWRET
jgi:hypothetical protein